MDLYLKLVITFLTITVTLANDPMLWRERSDVKQMVQSAKQTLSTVSLVDCAQECVKQDGGCLLFSYDRHEEVCYLDPVLTDGVSGEVHYRKDCSSLTDYTYMPDRESCIKVVLTPMNWTDAWAVCRREGARLLHVKDEIKRDQLGQVLTELGIYGTYEFWVDASDLLEDGVYVWGDGTTVNANLFDKYEPSNNNGEDCVRIRKNMYLADRECSWVEYQVICEQY